MGIDTKLYLNSKYEIRDIVKVLETRFDLVDQTVKATDYRPEHKAKVRVEAALPSTPEFYHIFFQREGHDVRMVSLFLHHQTPIGNCIYLSLSHNEEAILIFRTLAEVLGGMLIENDCNGTIEEIDGMLNDEDDLSYFLKYAVINNKLSKDDDVEGLAEVIKEWKGEQRRR